MRTRLNFPRPVRAVLLDMDGLLFDTERVYVAALIDAARELGFEMTLDFAHSMIGVPGPECNARIQGFFGPAFPMSTFGAAYAAHKEAWMRAGVPLKPGVLELLDYLERGDTPKAIVTSSGRGTAESYLARTGLASRFNALVTREDVLRTKPIPDPYLKGASLLQVDPMCSLVLEDSHFGIRAAHAAGTMPVMIPDLVPATEEMHALCVAVARDLHEVRSLLEP